MTRKSEIVTLVLIGSALLLGGYFCSDDNGTGRRRWRLWPFGSHYSSKRTTSTPTPSGSHVTSRGGFGHGAGIGG